MRIAHYERNRVPLQIIIAVWINRCHQLVEDLKQDYFQSLFNSDKIKEKGIDVELHVGKHSLRETYGVTVIDGYSYTPKVDKINALARSVKTCKKEDVVFLR